VLKPEVGAMLQEVKRGRVLVLNEQQYIHNQSVRCTALPPDDREDCQRRMGGQGTTQGSAESGGIYRELTRSLPPEKP
jgi:hypothetical protein